MEIRASLVCISEGRMFRTEAVQGHEARIWVPYISRSVSWFSARPYGTRARPSKNLNSHIRSSQAINIKTTIFWNVTPCSLVSAYQLYGGNSCLYLQGETGKRPLRWVSTHQSSYTASHPRRPQCLVSSAWRAPGDRPTVKFTRNFGQPWGSILVAPGLCIRHPPSGCIPYTTLCLANICPRKSALPIRNTDEFDNNLPLLRRCLSSAAKVTNKPTCRVFVQSIQWENISDSGKVNLFSPWISSLIWFTFSSVLKLQNDFTNFFCLYSLFLHWTERITARSTVKHMTNRVRYMCLQQDPYFTQRAIRTQ